MLAVLVAATGLDIADDLFGEGAGRWLARNSEAWVLALLVPIHWEVLVPEFDPHSPRPGTEPRFGGPVASTLLIAAMLLVALVLGFDGTASALGLAPSITTWSESFLAAAVLAAYLGWSRGYLGNSRPMGGAPVASWRGRAALYAVLFAYAAAVLFDVEIDWIRDNAETHWAILVIAAWFDLVATRTQPRTAVVAACWFALLLAVPLVSSSEILERGVFAGTIAADASVWLGRTTEANLAGALISAYFWIRSKP